MALTYLVNRFFYRIKEFLRHWYIGGFGVIFRLTVNVLETLDRRFALKVTLRHFFQPLYQDYTLAGYVFGLFFRSARSISAIVIYTTVLAFTITIYAIWTAIPVYIIFKIINPN